MQFIIDTHVFLWFIWDDPKLPQMMKSLISNRSNDRIFSIASVWEMSIKASMGKLSLTPRVPFDVAFAEQSTRNVLTILPIEMPHIAEIARLPFHHRDPFDRMLIAQALSENLPLMSADTAFDPYPIKRLW